MTAKREYEPSAAHIEALEHSTNASDQKYNVSSNDANEEIVRHLQTTGEDVGLTCVCSRKATAFSTCRF
jgi:hypothetical protein